MNQPSVRQEFDTIFDEDMAELNKLYSMTEKLEGRLKVMKETYEKAMQTQYENGYIQGFRDRYEGIQPRYKDINEKAIEWYDYSSMEMYRLHEVKFDSLESNIERLQDDNYQLYKENQNLAEILDENETTIKRVQVERDEFQCALAKAEDDINELILSEKWNE
jgi:chromosome segregation ATPase